MEECSAYKAFERLLGPLSFDLFTLTPPQMKALHQRINETPHLLLSLIRRYVLDEIEQSPEQLNTNAQIFSMIFKGLKGFTGTMWNSETFPNAFAELFLSDTDVKTLHLLAVKGLNLPPQILEKTIESQEEILDALRNMFQGSPVGSVADAGGIFRNFDNSLVAKKLLELQEKDGYQGVIFYDQQNNLMILEKGKSVPISLASSDLPFYKMAAYWDQKHTTGSDLQLASDMHAAVTISRHTMMRDLLQTVWRLRKLDKSQTISYALLEEDWKVISSALEKIRGAESENPLGDLFLYLWYNQAQRQGEDNFRGTLQKLHNILLDPLVKAFGDPTVTDDEILEIFAITRELFVSSTVKDFYPAIGKLKTAASSDSVLKEIAAKFIRSPAFQAFRSHPVLRSRCDIDEMEKQIALVIKEELPRLSEKLIKTENYNREIEVETEIKKELNTETEQEREKEKLTFGVDYMPYPVFVWDKTALFDKKSYAPLNFASFSRAPEIPNLSQTSWKDRGFSSFFTIQNAIDQTQDKKTSNIRFDSNLLSTFNFSPLYLLKPSKTQDFTKFPHYDPFGQYQDPSMHLFLIEDKSTGKIQTAMIDLEDAKVFDKWLKEDRKSPFLGKREVKLGLYHLANGLYREGSEPIDEEALETNPSFLRLKAQAKFFNGHFSFTKEEWPFLVKWIESQGKQRIRDLLEKILASKPTSRRSYPYTELFEFLS